VPEPLQQVIKGIQCQRSGDRLPRRADGQAAEPFVNDLPDQCRGEIVTRQHPCEQNRECAATAAPLSAVGTKHPLPSGDTPLLGLRIVTLDQTMAIECTDMFAERTSYGLYCAKELLKAR